MLRPVSPSLESAPLEQAHAAPVPSLPFLCPALRRARPRGLSRSGEAGDFCCRREGPYSARANLLTRARSQSFPATEKVSINPERGR